MSNRKAISKRTRFDILKRDGFACRYCGAKAPDVVLEIDHVKPVAGGGCNCMSNLVTACYECNRGKGVIVVGDIGADDDVSAADLFYDARRAAQHLEKNAREHFKDDTLCLEHLFLACVLLDAYSWERWERLWATHPDDEIGKAKYVEWLRKELLRYIMQVECPQ